MSDSFDVAIAGLGAMGSAVAYHLAARGQRVVAFDRFAPPHSMGSSHGRTRMIREAYYEHPLYVPLVQRAYALWGELERSCGRPIYLRTGGLMVGPEQGSLVQGTLRSAEAHALPHEVLSAAELHRRYPAFSPMDGMLGVFEARAGILFPETVLQAHLQLAATLGAELRPEAAVLGWESVPGGVEVRTGDDTRVRARQLVVAVGGWTAPFLADLALPLEVERQVIYWLDPVRFPEYHAPERMPVSIWELPGGSLFYTKPDLGDGVKTGFHHGGVTTTADTVSRQVTADEDAAIYDLLRRFVPFAKGHVRDRAVCLYTNTPDGHFIVDWHPADENVLILSPCSGHGFKFASAIGEAAADLLLTGTARFDLTPFSLSRFKSSAD